MAANGVNQLMIFKINNRIHKDQLEKWEEEMKEVRADDSANEEARSLLHNAQFHLFQNVREDP